MSSSRRHRDGHLEVAPANNTVAALSTQNPNEALRLFLIIFIRQFCNHACPDTEKSEEVFKSK